MSTLISLEGCPPGPFLYEYGGNWHLGFKTEYRAMEAVGPVEVPGDQIRWKVGRWPEAFVAESGEVFWGGAKSHEERAALMVRPLSIDILPTGELLGATITERDV